MLYSDLALIKSINIRLLQPDYRYEGISANVQHVHTADEMLRADSQVFLINKPPLHIWVSSDWAMKSNPEAIGELISIRSNGNGD